MHDTFTSNQFVARGLAYANRLEIRRHGVRVKQGLEASSEQVGGRRLNHPSRLPGSPRRKASQERRSVALAGTDRSVLCCVDPKSPT